MGTPRAVGGQAELCTEGEELLLEEGVFGSLGSWRAPWLAASEPSLVIIRWHLCGKKGLIARRGSPQLSVCLSVHLSRLALPISSPWSPS